MVYVEPQGLIEAGGAAEVVGAMTRLAEHVEVQEQCSEVSGYVSEYDLAK